MVAIKGMKMPKNCIECLLFDDEYGDCNVMGETKADMTEERAGNCPLVEIVTCKDCKNECTEKNGEKFSETRPDFFCADGERGEK